MTALVHSRFVWGTRKDVQKNRYLAFQKEFRLTRLPEEAQLRISAYACYQVTVNGIAVGRGPDPSSDRRYYYDPYDVQAYLRRGRNVINVLCYTFGPELPWPETSYLPGEYGWLRFELEYRLKKNSQFVVSDAGCRVRTVDAWKRYAPGYTELRAAHKEYYDSRRFGYEALIPSDTHDKAWRPAVELQPEDLKYSYAFFPKEIKAFVWTDKYPAASFAIDGGFAYGFTAKRGWQIENAEALTANYPVEKYYEILQKGEPNFPERRMEADAQNRCVIRKFPNCGTPSLLIDFGGMQYGTLHLNLHTAAPGSVIEIGYGESLNITNIDRYTTRAGSQTFSPFHFRAGRYVLLTFTKIVAPICLNSVMFRRCDYSVENNPNAFVSSSDLLNRIENASINTLRLNMHSHFEDCPWREQKMYLGDMYVEALAAYYTWGEYDYMRKNLIQLAAREREDGWISSGPGYPRGTGLIIDFPVHFIMQLRDYYLFSGDRETLEKLYPKAIRVLDNYLNMGVFQDGLVDIGEADSFANWCVINWNDVVKKGKCAPLNFLVLRALRAAADMAHWLNLPQEKAKFLNILRRLHHSCDKTFWDSSKGMYRDGRYKGRAINHYSTETNTLAILAGVPDRIKTKSILRVFGDGKLDMETPTAYFNAFVAESLFMSGKTESALRLIENHWGKMLDRGGDSFWEMFVPDTPAGAYPPKMTSLCHGWASGPAYLFPAYVLGIRPVAPAFERFVVAPQLGNLTAASASVPTPHGAIDVHYEAGMLRVVHPRRTSPLVSEKIGSNIGIALQQC